LTTSRPLLGSPSLGLGDTGLNHFECTFGQSRSWNTVLGLSLGFGRDHFKTLLGSPGLGLGDTGLSLDHFENTSGLHILAEFLKNPAESKILGLYCTFINFCFNCSMILQQI